MQNFYKFQKILCIIVLLTTCGCLYPSASNSEPSGPTPPPDSKVLAIANSLSNAEREDCVKMYGVFTAFSRYIEDGHRGIDNTKQMLDLWKKTLDNLGWDKEKYLKQYLTLAKHYKSKQIFENLLKTILNKNGG